MKRLTAWILEKWDWMIYGFAQGSIRRMCERNQGFAYLFELWIREWRPQHPIPKQLGFSTEIVFESLKTHKGNKQ